MRRLLALTLALMPIPVLAQPIYLQLHHGQATDTDFGAALLFAYDRAAEKTRATAISIGRPLSDNLFGWPADVIGYLGVQQFAERHRQSDGWGASAYVKISKDFQVPFTKIPMRVGLGQGLSYVSRIPVVEQRDFAPSTSNKLMVYLEYTLQVSLMRWLDKRLISPSIEDLSLGYSIVHRSSAYGTFAETGGGVNYLGIGLTVRFR